MRTCFGGYSPVEKPAWVVEKETRNNISNNSNNSSGDNSNNAFNHRNKRFKSNSKEPTQEINHEKDSRFNIPVDKLKYGKVFTAGTRKAFGKTIRNDKNSIIYHRLLPYQRNLQYKLQDEKFT